jgi:hypothetical protein
MAWFGGFTLETYNRIPGEYEVLTVVDAVVALSSAKIKPQSGLYARLSARAALLTLEGGDVRFRLDGGQPSASDGHYFSSGDALVISGTQSLQKFVAIKTGDAGGTLRVTYFY